MTKTTKTFPKRYLIIIAVIASVAIWILFAVRYTTGTFNPFFVVASDSMVPTLQVGDLLIIQHAPVPPSSFSSSNSDAASTVSSPSSYDNLKVGDIILFKNPHIVSKDTRQPVTFVHRIAQINTTTMTTTTASLDNSNNANNNNSTQRILKTKGDHNPASIPRLDYPIYKSYYVGKVIYVIPKVGIPFLYISNLLGNNNNNMPR